MVCHIFNASHDEALAFGGENFTPSAAARQIDHDLAALPYWYAKSGDTVLVKNADETSGFLDALPIRREVAVVPDFSCIRPTAIQPWGWDRLVVKTLEKLGAPADALPDTHFLSLIRALQSRETNSKYIPIVFGEIVAQHADKACLFSGDSCFVRNLTDLQACAAFRSGRYIMKKPWSGSGRGLFVSQDGNAGRAMKWFASAIREQGGVEVQSFLENAGDCAVEFEISGNGEVSLMGYSDFQTARGGAYTGNSVKAGVDKDICNKLGASHDALQIATETMERTLSKALPGYVGPVGVDMMISHSGDDGQLRLFPCVEINLRRTMGMVAVALTPLVAEGSTGSYLTLFERKPGEMLRKSKDLQQNKPLEVCNGKIISGYLPLTFIEENTRFHACLMVEKMAEE